MKKKCAVIVQGEKHQWVFYADGDDDDLDAWADRRGHSQQHPCVATGFPDNPELWVERAKASESSDEHSEERP